MPFTVSKKTTKNLDKIKELLKKEPLYANQLAREVGVRPEMINYYMKKYLHDDVEQMKDEKEGSNIFLRLKKK